MNPYVAGAGIVSNIIGGIAGREAGRDAAGEANNAMNVAFEELNRIGLPPDLSKQIIYDQFKQQGLMTPELEQNINAGPAEVSKITEDPSLKTAQMEALKILQQRGKGGLTPEDRAALNQIRDQVSQDAESKRQQILQNFQSRGQGGSGAELIASLQASQSGANNASQQGDRLGAMASQNALQSISQAGTLGGQIRSQDFGVNEAKAQAQDAINKFNVQNQIGTQERNVGAKNSAQMSNLNTAQNLSNANVQQSNQEKLRQNTAKRQLWLDESARQQMRAGAMIDKAKQLMGQSSAASESASAPWEMIGAGATAIGSKMGSPSAPAADPMTGATRMSDPTQYKFYEGGKVEDPNESSVSGFLKSVRKSFGNPDQPKKEESQEEKYAKIRAQNSANMGYNDGGAVQDYRNGGKVPGVAPFPGDHPGNDIVSAQLSPDELVVPRTIAKSPFGKKLAKLLEAHSEVMKHAKDQ